MLYDGRLNNSHQSRPEHVKPTPETLATICYTSGTTGMPKVRYFLEM